MNYRLTTAGQCVRVLHCLCRFRSTFAGSLIPTSGVRNTDTQARIQQAQPRSAFQGLFLRSFVGEIYLAISIRAPTAASTKPMWNTRRPRWRSILFLLLAQSRCIRLARGIHEHLRRNNSLKTVAPTKRIRSHPIIRSPYEFGIS